MASAILDGPARAPTEAVRASRWPLGAAAVVWLAFLFLYGINSGELYRNEGLRARIAQEMLWSGEWIVPHLYGEPILTKPPVLYWSVALLSWPFGAVTMATARMPSVLAGFFTAGLFFWHFRRCLGRRAGCLAAIILPMSIFWMEKVPSAEIDALQVAWVSGAILFLLRGMESRSIGWWLAAGACLAGGTLTKWTAPAYFYLTALPLLWWRGELHMLARRGHVLCFAVAMGLVGGWVWLVCAQTGVDAFWQAVRMEASPRLVPGANPRPYPWLETLCHPLVVLAANLPWSLGLLWRGRVAESTCVADDTRRERARLFYQALHCWLWPNLLFWTLHPDHTLRNRAPLFPAIAGLAVFAIVAWQRGSRRRGSRRRVVSEAHWWLASFLCVWMVLKIVHVEVVLAQRALARDVRGKANLLAAALPRGSSIYVFRLKDECLMFYLGREVQRLPDRDAAPQTGARCFCILTEEEWRDWSGPGRLVLEVRDGQGAPICLIALHQPED